MEKYVVEWAICGQTEILASSIDEANHIFDTQYANRELADYGDLDRLTTFPASSILSRSQRLEKAHDAHD